MTDTLDDFLDEYATYCPDCDAYFAEGEDGFGNEECLECGSFDVYEVIW